MSKMEALLYSFLYHTLFTPLQKYTIGIIGSPYKTAKTLKKQMDKQMEKHENETNGIKHT